MSQQATNLPSTYLSKTPKHHCQDQHRHWSGTNQEIGILFPLASGHRCRDLHPLASLPHLPLWLEVPRHSTCDFFVFVEVISPGHPCWETRFLLYLIIQIYQHKLTNKHTSVSGISIFTIPNKKTKLHNFFESKLVKFTAFQNQSQGTHPSVLPCWWNRYHLCPTSWRLPGFSSNNSTSTLVTLPPFGGVESLNIKKGWVQCSKHNIWCWMLEKLWRIGLSPKQWWCVDAKLKHLMLSNVKSRHCQKAVVLCPPWFFVENSSTHPRISSLSL